MISECGFDDNIVRSMLELVLGPTSYMLPDQIFHVLEALTNRCLVMRPDLNEIGRLLYDDPFIDV